MTKSGKKKLLSKITAEIGEVNNYLAALEKSSESLSAEKDAGCSTHRDFIKMKSLNEGARREARSKLNRLERALGKINEPDFGLCFVCEEPIPFSRLMQMPEASRCVDCEGK